MSLGLESLATGRGRSLRYCVWNNSKEEAFQGSFFWAFESLYFMSGARLQCIEYI